MSDPHDPSNPTPPETASKPLSRLALLRASVDPTQTTPEPQNAPQGLLRPPTSGGFQPGPDPRRAVNPSKRGRPKRSLAEAIRIATSDLTDQIAFMVNVSKGLNREGQPDPDITYRDSMEAVKYLTDRGYGKALETVAQLELDAKENPMAELSLEELKALAKLG